MAAQYVVEHLNHVGMVAEVCCEIGVADWLDQHESTSRRQVSVGTATVALVLNGLGWSNRQWYLVPQFFADKPVEHLLGAGIRAEHLNDDCLGRTLDWLYAHDVTTLFAGLALRARRAFSVTTHRLHADTTSFSVHGQDASKPPREVGSAPAPSPATTPLEEAEEVPAVIQVTYGYSRDRREDLKPWMVALISSGEGVPQFLQPLDGNASDKRALLKAVTALTQQLKASGEAAGVYVADSGIYSTENMTILNAAGIPWASREPETTTTAEGIVREEPAAWQMSADGTRQWWSLVLDLPQGRERWIVVRSKEGEAGARATMQRQAEGDRTTWTQRLWHLGNQSFACQVDAEAALAKACQRLPAWVQVQAQVVAVPKHEKPGCPAMKQCSTRRGAFVVHVLLTASKLAKRSNTCPSASKMGVVLGTVRQSTRKPGGCGKKPESRPTVRSLSAAFGSRKLRPIWLVSPGAPPLLNPCKIRPKGVPCRP